MPQMMPMNWIFMFIMLNSLLSMILIMLFNFTTNNFFKSSSEENDNKSNMWVW